MTFDPKTDPVLYLREGVLGTRWGNGDMLDGITSRTASMIAEHIAAGPLTLLILDDMEAAVVTDALRAYDATHVGPITRILADVLRRLEPVSS